MKCVPLFLKICIDLINNGNETLMQNDDTGRGLLWEHRFIREFY